MKTIDLADQVPTIQALLELASQENVMLRTADGKEFVVAEVDDFANEVALVRQNPELMAFLDERSRETSRHSLDDVRKELGL